MFDYSKLKGRIIEKYDSQSAFADAIGVKVQAVNAKLRGRVSISKADIIKWSQALDIETNDIGAYFFTVKV